MTNVWILIPYAQNAILSTHDEQRVKSKRHFLPDNGESPCMPAGQGYYIKLADGVAQNIGGQIKSKFMPKVVKR